MQEIVVYAPAKLNLYLDVLRKRPDGYHDIETLFEKIDLKDEIIIREKKTKGIDVKVEPPGVCLSGRDNIIYKAVDLLMKESRRGLGLEIIIKKKIPVSGGLGGGSSDAAVVLTCINKRFGLSIDAKKFFTIATKLGKDVPFFLMDETFVKGTGMGEVLEPIEADIELFHIIIKPPISISTKTMYERLDKYGLIKKTKGFSLDKIISALKDKDLDLLKETSYNIFEKVLGSYAGLVKEAKSLLIQIGQPAFMSGSGPSVFCIFKEREEAMSALDKIPEKKGFDVFFATSYKGGGDIYGDN